MNPQQAFFCFQNFYNQIAKVQEEALSWLYSVAMKLYRPQKFDYHAALYKVRIF